MQLAKISILLLGIALLIFYFVAARRCCHDCRSGKESTCKCSCGCKGKGKIIKPCSLLACGGENRA